MQLPATILSSQTAIKQFLVAFFVCQVCPTRRSLKWLTVQAFPYAQIMKLLKVYNQALHLATDMDKRMN